MSSRVGSALIVLCAFVTGLLFAGPIAKAASDAAQAFACKSKKGACVTAINSSFGAGVGALSKGVGVAGFGGATPAPGAGATGLGVYGLGTKNGMIGQSATGVGVTGVSGVAPSGTSSGYGVIGSGPNDGVLGTSPAIGVTAMSTSTSSSENALEAVTFTGASLFQATNGSTSQVNIFNNGDIHTTGKIFTSVCTAGCQRPHVESYASSGAVPTLEDTGESQLRGGATFVHLSPDFASAIDPRAGYFVLVTPEGATNGVYVSQRTMQGFMVRENPGGHSNAEFAYRIVAHPYGDRSPRLPFRSLSFRNIPH